MFELEKSRQETGPAPRLGGQHQRRVLPGDARIAGQARELAIKRLRGVRKKLGIHRDRESSAFGLDCGFHLAFGGGTRGQCRQVGKQALFDPEAQQRIEARVLHHRGRDGDEPEVADVE